MGARKGDGSVFQRKDGRWVAQLDWPSEGKRQRRQRVVATQAGATAALRELRARRDSGRAAPSAQRLGAFLDQWAATMQPRVAPATYARRVYVIAHYLQPALGRVPLPALTPLHVQRMLDGIQTTKGPGGWTRVGVHAVLRAALADALRWRLVDYNAAALVHGPPAPKHPPVILTPAQAQTLVAAVAGTAWDALLHLALYAALRQGEMLALRWRDVDLTAATVTITATLDRVTRTRVPPKTPGSEGVVPLSAPVLAALKAHRQRQPGLPDAFLFTEPANGLPLGAGTVGRHWRGLLRACGLPPMHFHDLRSTALTWLSEAGVPVGTVKDIARHASAVTTLGIYVRTPLDSQRAGVDAVARLREAADPPQSKESL